MEGARFINVVSSPVKHEQRFPGNPEQDKFTCRIAPVANASLLLCLVSQLPSSENSTYAEK